MQAPARRDPEAAVNAVWQAQACGAGLMMLLRGYRSLRLQIDEG